MIFSAWLCAASVMAAPSARNQSVGAASHGGYLVETQLLTGSFIDLVRNPAAFVFASGNA